MFQIAQKFCSDKSGLKIKAKSNNEGFFLNLYEYYVHIHEKKFKNIEEMDRFLGKYKSKLHQEDLETLIRTIPM